MRIKSKFSDECPLPIIEEGNRFSHPEFGDVSIDFHPLGLPVRHIITHGGKRTVGSFPSAKMGRTMPWESWWERDLIRQLECDPDVIGYLVQPHLMHWVCEGVPQVYTPEAIVETIHGILVFECKREHPAVHGDEAAVKYRMAQRIYAHIGWDFQIMTGSMLWRNPNKVLNQKLLCGARNTHFDFAAELSVREYLRTQGGLALYSALVSALAQDLHIAQSRAEAMILAMAIKRIVRFDLEKRISGISLVKLVAPRAPAMQILNFWEKANG